VISRVLKERLTVPHEAVFRRGQLEGVYVIGDDGRAHLRWISTGRKFAEGIEVLAGLDPGEVVVLGSDSRLRDGQRVEVTN
jgi:multidrug efflux pump subunit AcrA (membrane-fusion protein)